VYAREFDGKAHNFGVLGVDTGTLIMYDEESGSHWSQLFGEAVDGPMKGRELDKFDSTLTTWKQWRAEHPRTTVYIKPSVPYNVRFDQKTFAEIANMADGPIRANDLVVGLEGHIASRVYLWRDLAKGRLVLEIFESQPILVYLSEDLTTAKAFHREVAFVTLNFELAADDRLSDNLTGTLWNPITGAAESGPLSWFGLNLQPIISTYAVWFAWEKYRPDTLVYRADGS
jgi:hypothetical protein